MGLLVECPKCKYRNSPKRNECKKCNFVLKKSSGKVYWIEYTNMGRKRERIGPNKAAAEQRLREVLSARTSGIYIKKPRDENKTFSDLAHRYHEWSKINNKSYHVNKKYFIEKLTEHFGSRG